MSRSTKRDVVIEALEFRPPPYIPWAWGPTERAAERLRLHLGVEDLSDFLSSHFVDVEASFSRLEPIGNDLYRDAYDVVWDRSIDKDIGTPSSWPIRRPSTPTSRPCWRRSPTALGGTRWVFRSTSGRGRCGE